MSALDSTTQLETPEGVHLELSVAGPMPRILAWVVDAAIRFAVYSVLATVVSTLSNFGYGVLLIAVFALEWFYPVFFEVMWSGATPGKQILRIRVLHEDGTPVGLSASMVRNLLRAIDFLPFLYGFGFVTMVVDPRFRRLGDLAAGTIVVYASREEARSERPAVAANPPPVALTRDEQRAVLEFAERAPRLAPARAEELAALATPVGGDRGRAVQSLYGVANHLAGSS